MTRQERIDQGLADWLEAGPYDAPDRVLEAALDHAQRHPRRRFSVVRVARNALHRVHPVDPIPGDPPSSRTSRFAAVGVAAVLIVAVVGGWAIVTSAPRGGMPVAGPTSPSPTPTVTPTPSPLATPPAWVTATTTCVEAAPGREEVHGTVSELRGSVLTCTLSSSDPRLAGTATVDLNIDLRADKSADMWGSAMIENEGGGWQGYWIGSVDEGYTTHHMEIVYLGSGGYEGLRLRTSQTSDGGDGVITGTIEAADALPAGNVAVIASGSCRTTAPGSSAAVGAVTQYRNTTLACTVEASDPRLVAPTERILLNADVEADGSATIWGTSTLINDGGTWSESWTGTVETGYTTHRMEGVAVGSGGYEGLEFRWTQIGEPELLIRTGTISSASSR